MLTNLEGLTVEEIMSPSVRCLDGSATVKEAARFFLDTGVSGAPILDDERNPVGVLTLRDLTRYLAHHLELEEIEELDAMDPDLAELRRKYGIGDLFLDRLRDVRVEQIMTPRVLSVHDDLAVERAIRFMGNEGVHRLFVADSTGKLVGVLSASDVVNALGGRPNRLAIERDDPRQAAGG
jgi:predicted transcriptional regulator